MGSVRRTVAPFTIRDLVQKALDVGHEIGFDAPVYARIIEGAAGEPGAAFLPIGFAIAGRDESGPALFLLRETT